jgi:hypothetical protein
MEKADRMPIRRQMEFGVKALSQIILGVLG